MKASAPALSSLSIGTIVAYGGDLSNSQNVTALNQQGWYLCDGSSLSSGQFSDLYKAIGNSNGGNATNFNLPDLRSRFMRGVSGAAAGIDPDVNSRIAALAGGATGNNVGSLQKTATSLPVNQWVFQHAGLHTHTCTHLNSDMHMAWSGSTYRMARWNATAQTDNAGAHFHSLTGFDNATVPINVALYFIIKASEPQGPSGTIPAGAIVAFGGTMKTVPSKWLRCDGAAYGVNLYPNLVGNIYYNYGGDAVTVFNVPDFRGYFLRGTSHMTSRDPDAASRHALNTGGGSGDNIGSAQFTGTGNPAALAVSTSSAHSHNIALVPHVDKSETVQFCVSDTGVGINPENLERIFTPYKQADDSIAKKYGGTGLGLSICKRLIERMGGKIWVESKVGVGTDFYFTIKTPITKISPKKNDLAFGPHSILDLRGFRLLIIDDAEDNRQLMEFLLKKTGARITFAKDGWMGVKEFKKSHYDLVFVDVQMPRLNGHHTMKLIRRIEKRDQKERGYIFALTGGTLPEEIDLCMKAGADEFIAKPIVKDRLFEVLDSYKGRI